VETSEVSAHFAGGNRKLEHVVNPPSGGWNDSEAGSSALSILRIRVAKYLVTGDQFPPSPKKALVFDLFLRSANDYKNRSARVSVRVPNPVQTKQPGDPGYLIWLPKATFSIRKLKRRIMLIRRLLELERYQSTALKGRDVHLRQRKQV